MAIFKVYFKRLGTSLVELDVPDNNVKPEDYDLARAIAKDRLECLGHTDDEIAFCSWDSTIHIWCND